ncbi:Alcohol dehydrogenase [Bacillus sp. THAF10]|uniref:NAD(P)-dependent alcohol dehydrogenase n=1 Tax=Bacillus sp. THAF10 TaxID=2587848 RepID=UPI00126890C2|nr:NAD(P)-dependent alcohol dehydrogenase [Bacillus sp. THAF10]QFT89549.1 Alcohol dehydrogenase [Bacillus sp. THAF10]
MKAVVYSKYGPPEVLTLTTLDKPKPKNNEILIKVAASAVNAADWRLRKAEPALVRFFFGLTKPKQPVLGGVFSGEVVETGTNVSRFKKGDQVFGSAGLKMGGYAEYICIPETAILSEKPVSLTYQEASCIPFGGTTAIYFLKKAGIQKGQKVLIYGASGAVGTAAVQLAVHFGAEVTGVCSTANLEMVREIGAKKVIDYLKDDLTASLERYDIIFDTVGKMPYQALKASLKEKGTLILCGAGLGQMTQGQWLKLRHGINVLAGVARERQDDLHYLTALAEQGEWKVVMDKSYKLEEIVEAHRYVEQGHKKGNVAIVVGEE